MASKDNIGTCRLCLRTGVELIDGHIVPSWAYYRCSLHGVPGRNPKMNPNPWILSSDAVVQTSRQVREYMLCGNCEQRFGIDETYASTLAYQADGTASLFFDQIIRDEGEGIDLPVPARAPGIDLARLARFGSSVLWRAHVSIQIPECKLGKYGDNFRLYLSGEGEFPPDAAIVLRFFEDSPRTCRSRIGRVCVFPSSRSAGGYHLHTLVICGMRFEIAVGRCIVCLRHTCMTAGTGPGYRGPGESGAACPTGGISPASGNPASPHRRLHLWSARAARPSERR